MQGFERFEFLFRKEFSAQESFQEGVFYFLHILSLSDIIISQKRSISCTKKDRAACLGNLRPVSYPMSYLNSYPSGTQRYPLLLFLQKTTSCLKNCNRIFKTACPNFFHIAATSPFSRCTRCNHCKSLFRLLSYRNEPCNSTWRPFSALYWYTG